MTKITNLQKFQFALCSAASLFMMTFAKLEGDKKSCCECEVVLQVNFKLLNFERKKIFYHYFFCRL